MMSLNITRSHNNNGQNPEMTIDREQGQRASKTVSPRVQWDLAQCSGTKITKIPNQTQERGATINQFLEPT